MLLWFRYAFQAVVTFVLRFPVQHTRLFATPNPRFQALRGVLLLITTACAFFGLQFLPVGEFTAMAMLSPMVASAMAAWTLKAHVSPRRWAMMSLGLLGVLLVVRPGGPGLWLGLVVPGGAGDLVRLVSGAHQPTQWRRKPPYTTHFYTGLVGAVVMTPIMLFSWKTSALLSYWYWFVLVGIFGTFGHLMLIRAFNRANAVVLTPYLYTQIAFATVLGWLVFRHAPDGLAWAGIAVIAASGVGNAMLSAREAAGLRQ